MKRCSNPDCRSHYLFGSSRTVCPFCHSVLVENEVPRPGQGGQQVMPADMAAAEMRPAPARPQELVRRRRGNQLECYGRITEIDHQELFTDARHKLLHTLLRGEPYQISLQTVEYTIRVENLTGGLPTEVKDFCLYGSYLGRLQVGDQVVVKAVDRGDRRVVKSIFNETTGSKVRPGMQISPWLVRGFFLAALLLVFALICQIVWIFRSGAAAEGAVALAMAVMPLAILGFGLYWLVRKIFPGRRRR